MESRRRMNCNQCDAEDVVFHIERGIVLCQACQQAKDRQQELPDNGTETGISSPSEKTKS
jgi:hypothetical protein